MLNFSHLVLSVSLLGGMLPKGGESLVGVSATWVVAVEERVNRTLLGDWEVPQWLAVAYTREWPDALQVISGALPQEVRLLVLTTETDSAREVMRWSGEVETPVWLVDVGADTPWVRDYGPLNVRDGDGSLIWIDGDYSSRPADDAVPEKLGRLFGVSVESVGEALEGGAFISNGQGLCASTRDFFEHEGIDYSNQEWMSALLQQIGCRALALIPALAYDPTRHADMLAQFTGPSSVVVAEFDPTTDPVDAERGTEAVRILRAAAARLGVHLRVDRVPAPAFDGEIYRSYVNFVSVGSTTFVPSFDSVSLGLESRAFLALSEALGTQLVPVPADAMALLNGGVHCMTWALPHQKPKPAAQWAVK